MVSVLDCGLNSLGLSLSPGIALCSWARHFTPGRRGVLPSNGLLGMCRWMGSHFHDSTDYNGVIFCSIFNRVTRMGLSFFGTLRLRKLFAQK